MTAKPVTQRSAFDLLVLLRTKKISALELANEYIRQIERLNPQINALVDFDPDRVRAQARSIDASTKKLGALAGLPVTVKSSISTAGYRCEIGSVVNRSRHVCWRTRQRQRRFRTGARAFHRHLLAEADSRTHSRHGASAALRRPIFVSRRHRSHGPHHRRREAVVSPALGAGFG